jgi:hypothetical protein
MSHLSSEPPSEESPLIAKNMSCSPHRRRVLPSSPPPLYFSMVLPSYPGFQHLARAANYQHTSNSGERRNTPTPQVEIQFLCTYEYYGSDFFLEGFGRYVCFMRQKDLDQIFLYTFLRGHSKVTVLYLCWAGLGQLVKKS